MPKKTTSYQKSILSPRSDTINAIITPKENLIKKFNRFAIVDLLTTSSLYKSSRFVGFVEHCVIRKRSTLITIAIFTNILMQFTLFSVIMAIIFYAFHFWKWHDTRSNALLSLYPTIIIFNLIYCFLVTKIVSNDIFTHLKAATRSPEGKHKGTNVVSPAVEWKTNLLTEIINSNNTTHNKWGVLTQRKKW